MKRLGKKDNNEMSNDQDSKASSSGLLKKTINATFVNKLKEGT
jgi:hypothetical protein